MLFELAYPGLCIRESVRRLTGRSAGGQPFTFRATKCKLRQREIRMMTTICPKAAARIALHRFERTRPKGIATATFSPDRSVHALAEARFGKQQGVRILLVHGWNAESAMMIPLARALSSRGAHVAVPDLPGEGSNPSRRFSFAKKARVLARNYGDEVFDAVIGHSAGSLTAAQAIEAGLKAKAMVTICAPFSIATLLQAYLIRTAAPTTLFKAVLDYYTVREGQDPRHVGPGTYAGFSDRLLVVHARSDWQVKVNEANEICAVAPRATQLILDGCNHHTILSSPRLHSATADFLMPPQPDGGALC